MSLNLIDAAKNVLPQDLINKAAGSLGESEGGIQKAISGAIPSVLSGLLSQSSGGNGGSGILDLVKNVAGSSVLNNISSLFTGSDTSVAGGGIGATVLGWLKSLFGDKLNSIINALAGFAGIKSSSASAILSMAAPAALAPVGKYASENGLTSSGLGSFLQSQKNSILSAIPSGFNLAGALGLGSIGDIGSKVTSIANHAADTTKKATSVKLLWPLVILAAIAALVFFLTQRGCNNPDAVSSTHTDTSSAVIETAEKKDMDKPSGKLDEATGNYIYDLGDTVSINLPNNAGELKVGKWSTEAKLVEFLANKDAVIDTIKGNWFDFTNVRFTTGGAAITEDSYSQLKNLVMIVKAFPAAQFKIGGYTDNTGDPANNISLSQKRADAVAQEVVKLGAGQTQITSAKGYGAEHPVGDNGTAEGRAMNRRVSVNVKAK